MPPKNPGPMMGSRSGKLEMKNPPGTTHGGQQAPREPQPGSLADRFKRGEFDEGNLPVTTPSPFAMHGNDQHNWTLILVPALIVAANAGADTRFGPTTGFSERDPNIRFMWPDMIRTMAHAIWSRCPRTIIESREFGFTRDNYDVREFLHMLRERHNQLRDTGYPAQWIQL